MREPAWDRNRQAMDDDELAISFDEVVERYEKRVFNLLLRMVDDYDEAADLTQDVFVQAYKALDSFRGDSKIYTWLYRIAINRCKNRIKQINRNAAYIAGSLDDPVDGEDTLSRDVPDLSNAPETYLERVELREVVQREIAQLPHDFRVVIVLRDLQGLSYREMADVIGISLEAVKSRLFRARTQLRERLTPYLRGEDIPPEPTASRRGPRRS